VQYKNPSRLYELRFATALTNPCIALKRGLRKRKGQNLKILAILLVFQHRRLEDEKIRFILSKFHAFGEG